MAVAQNPERPLTTIQLRINILLFFRLRITAVLWPSGYGVTFRYLPIRDGKPREFESRQCQLFFHCVYPILATTGMCYRVF